MRNKEPITIAWVSQHPMTPTQEIVLKELFHPRDVNIVQVSKTFQSVGSLRRTLSRLQARVAILVLPLSMIQVLLDEPHDGIEYWRSEVVRMHENCSGMKCRDYSVYHDTVVWDKKRRKYRHYRFKRFVKIDRIEIVTTPVTRQHVKKLLLR